MSDITELLSIIVPVITIGFVIALTSFNLYFTIRRKFPKTVNCWFCNENNRVSYQEKNCWVCPRCDQYNGFTEDGDYNRDIPAQRNTKLNGPVKIARDPNQAYSTIHSGIPNNNNFCASCNRNQEIKIHQLASFVPDSEDRYDEEIEEFRKKLEQAYRLCFRCERILKRTLNIVKQNILGSKLAQIGSLGLSVFDRHMVNSNIIVTSKKRLIVSRLVLISLAILSLYNLILLCQGWNISKTKLDKIFSPRISNILLIIISYLTALKMLLVKTFWKFTGFEFVNNIYDILGYCQNIGYNIFTDMTKTCNILTFNIVQYDPMLIADYVALTSIIIVFLITGLKRNNGLLFVLLLWSIKMIFPLMETHVNGSINNELCMNSLKFSLNGLLFLCSLINIKTMNANYNAYANCKLNDSFHRIYSDQSSDISDLSDNESEYLSTSHNSVRASKSYTKISPNKTNLNASLDSTKPMTESFLNSSAFQRSIANMNSSFDQSYLQKNNCGSSRESVFGDLRSSANSQFGSSNWRLNEIEDRKLMQTKSFPQTSFNNTNACYSTFGALNLANGYGLCRQSAISTPSLSQPSHISLRQRKPLLLHPSKLDLNSSLISSQQSQPLTQASWVAGGYWNNSSPKKNANFSPPIHSLGDLEPILSRTSSQSSGFESRTSSLINGTNNRSRESSIIPPENDQNSIISEQSAFPESVSQIGDEFAGNYFTDNSTASGLFSSEMFQKQQQQPHQLNGLVTPILSTAGTSKPMMPRQQEIFHNHNKFQQFEIQRRALKRTPSMCSFNFKKFTNDLPPIEQGSLLRNWKQNSLINVSQNMLN